MYQTRSEYDRGVNTYSPEGRLFQVEYAMRAVVLGTTAIGIQTSEGVVLVVEKRLTSPLVEPDSLEKIFEIDSHMCAAMSGLTADAGSLVEFARVETQHHRFVYDEPMSVESAAHAIADIALDFGKDKRRSRGRMSRPFGVALLLAGVDESGPALFQTDPSGTYTRWKACAVGSGSEGAQTALEEAYDSGMSLVDAETTALTILKQVMEEDLSTKNVQVASVTADGYRVYDKDALETIIARLPERVL
eukprot:PLAT1184.1.p1 GENE.PLAT1184.1~~PLAT1184.1.p1  ORF type:complete len:247 (-),score=102.77 PLAT1184.1:90-830(-)